MAEEGDRLTNEQGFQGLLAQVLLHRGAALLLQGNAEEGVHRMREAASLSRALGMRLDDGSVQSRLVKRTDAFEMRLAREELSYEIEGDAEKEVSVEQNGDVLLSPPNCQQLQGQLMCFLQLPA